MTKNAMHPVFETHMDPGDWGPDWKMIFRYSPMVFRFHVGLFQSVHPGPSCHLEMAVFSFIFRQTTTPGWYTALALRCGRTLHVCFAKAPGKDFEGLGLWAPRLVQSGCESQKNSCTS